MPQIVAPTCSGILCDRSIRSSLCACMNKDATESWVLSFILIPEDEDDPHAALYPIDRLQSFRTSTFFLSREVLDKPASVLDEDDIRACVDKIQDYVNENGGWYIAGYHKCGTNNSTSADNKIVKELKDFNITYLTPLKYLDLSAMQYKLDWRT